MITDSSPNTLTSKTVPGAPEYTALLCVLLLGAGLRLYHLGTPPLWLDEQCQLWVASEPTLSAVWERTRLSGPIGRVSYLDSALIWRLAPATRFYFRLPDVIEGIATLALLYFVGRRWFSARTGLLAAGLLAVSSLHIIYSREARGYALLTLLFLAQATLFDAVVRRPGSWPRAAALALITMLALTVHPLAAVASFGLALGAIASVCLSARPDDETNWRMSATVSAAAMLAGALVAYLCCYRGPIVTAVSSREPENSLLYDIVDAYKALIGGYWGAASYVVALACLGSFWAMHCRREWRWPILLCIGVAAMAALPVVAGHHFKSWVTPRYSLFAAPFLFLLAAGGIDALLDACAWKVQRKLTWAQAFIAPVIALLLIGSMLWQGRQPYDLEAYKKPSPNPFWPVLEQP